METTLSVLDEMMPVALAKKRLRSIQKTDKVEFLGGMDEVRLSGVFNVEDLEALYVLMLRCDAAPTSSGEQS